MEEWRTIQRHPNAEVSSLGNVRYKEKASRTDAASYPLGRAKIYPSASGYLQVVLNSQKEYVHVLVAEAFLGSRPDGKKVDHKDGSRNNCCKDNLQYISHSENVAKGSFNGGQPKLYLCEVQVMKMLLKALPAKTVASFFGCSAMTMSRIKANKLSRYKACKFN